MTHLERDLIFRIADGKPEAFPLIHQLCQFRRKLAIFDYLIKHKITGDKFLEYNMSRRCSMLKVGKDILEKIDHRRQAEIRAGIDLV